MVKEVIVTLITNSSWRMKINGDDRDGWRRIGRTRGSLARSGARTEGAWPPLHLHRNPRGFRSEAGAARRIPAGIHPDRWTQTRRRAADCSNLGPASVERIAGARHA